MPSPPNNLGLALSGGGYRASAFHLGTLKKLNELNILGKVDVISTISGGSITGAAWGLHEGDYDSFHTRMVENLKTKSVIKQVLTSSIFIFTILFALVFLGGAILLTFTRWAPFALVVLVLFFILLLKWQFKIFPVSRVIEKAYNKFFYGGKCLGDLKAKPIFAIGSSNLHTGRPFTFSKMRMSDSTYSSPSSYDPPIKFLQEKFPVARAVTASSCVPFAFTPVRIDKEFYQTASDYDRINPQLVDGGVYDNQGIQKITQPKSSYECKMIITSDAGGNFKANLKYGNTISLLMRTVNLFMHRIKAFQMVQNVYGNAEGKAQPIAYFSLGWEIQNCIPGFIQNMVEGQVINEVIEAQKLQPEWIKDPTKFRKEIHQQLERNVGYENIWKRNLSREEWQLACSTGTNLTPLPAKRLDCLIRHAENLTELQVKLYCPSLIDAGIKVY